MKWLNALWKKMTGSTSSGEPDESIVNFTPRAQQVLALAGREASRLGHHPVATEHLLLGLISLGKGVGFIVLKQSVWNLEALRQEVENQAGTDSIPEAQGAVPYTPRVKKALALATQEAKALHHTYVGTEHLLLGLLAEGEGVAARVLKLFKVDVKQMRQEILKELDPNFSPDDKGQTGTAG
jgi:ATP-dependent Clp protease ATP-binding subunit ClpC